MQPYINLCVSPSKLSHNPITKASQTSGHMNVTKLQRFGTYFLKLSILASSTQWDSTECARFSGPAARRDFRSLFFIEDRSAKAVFCSGINPNSFTEALEALHHWRWINAQAHVVALGCYITAWLWCCGFVLVHWAWMAPEVPLRDFKRYSRYQIPEQTLSEQSSP